MYECAANSHTHHTALMRCLDYLLTRLIVEALAMTDAGIEQVKVEGFTCSLVGESERKGFDYKRMIKEHPDLSSYVTEDGVKDEIIGL